MAKLYDSLLVPEAYSALNPYKFVTGIIKCIRTTTAHLAQLLGLSLRTLPTRPFYKHVSVRVSEIKSAAVVVNSERQVQYTATLPVADIDIIGAFLEEPAIRGRDFTCTDNVYTFKKHPSLYGSITTYNGEPVLDLVCVGGGFSDYLNPLSLPYHGCVDATATDAIKDSLAGVAPLGVTARLIEAVGGARLSTGILTDVWNEGDYRMGLTSSGELVYTPSSSGIIFKVGKAIDTAAVTNPLTDIFYAQLTSGPTILKKGVNAVADHPKIADDIPGISIVNDTFQGVEVLAKLLDAGYVFYHWPKIDKTSGFSALIHYPVNPGKVGITTTATGAVTCSYQDTSSKYSPVEWTVSSKAHAYNYI